MAMGWETFVSATFFGGIAFIGSLLGRWVCKAMVPFEDGPRQGKPPTAALLIGNGLLGGSLYRHGASESELLVVALLSLSLIAGCVSDVLRGIIPDAFTLLPLTGLITVRIFLGEWDFLVAGVLVFLPFALVALCSSGRGMGWGDVKLAALGGVVLGVSNALMSFIFASVLAVTIAWIRGRMHEPIAFGPYLVCAVGAALVITGFKL
jgi:leader peptidase (prepilin peptidase)/N-methyltransferase